MFIKNLIFLLILFHGVDGSKHKMDAPNTAPIIIVVIVTCLLIVVVTTYFDATEKVHEIIFFARNCPQLNILNEIELNNFPVDLDLDDYRHSYNPQDDNDDESSEIKKMERLAEIHKILNPLDLNHSPLRDLYSKLDITQHRLILEDQLILVTRSERIPMHVILLDDMILLVKEAENLLVLRYIYDENTNYAPIILLKKTSVARLANLIHAFNVKVETEYTGVVLYRLEAPDKYAADRWITNIRRAIRNNRSVEKENFPGYKKLDDFFKIEPLIPQINERLSAKEREIQQLSRNLFEEVFQYMKYLEILKVIYYEKMSYMVPPILYNLLFSGFKQIYDVNFSFSLKFKNMIRIDTQISDISQTLLEYFSGELLYTIKSVFVEFFMRQSYALEKFSAHHKKDRLLDTYITKMSKEHKGMSFDGLMTYGSTIFQRYNLIIEKFRRLYSELPGKDNSFEKVGDTIKNIIDAIHAAVSKNEKFHNLMNSIDDTMNRERNIQFESLIHEGDLIWKIAGGKKFPVHVLLLTNYIMILQKDKEKLRLCSEWKEEGSNFIYRYEPIVKMDDFKPIFNFQEKSTEFELDLYVKNEKYNYKFETNKLEERSTWCNEINRTIQIWFLAIKNWKPVAPRRNMEDAMHNLYKRIFKDEYDRFIDELIDVPFYRLIFHYRSCLGSDEKYKELESEMDKLLLSPDNKSA